MRTMDIFSLLVLALQAEKRSTSEIKKVLYSLSSCDEKNIAEIKSSLLKRNLIHLFPSELAWNYALDIDHKNTSYGITSYSIISSGYPKYLKVIDNAPLILHVRGNTSLLNSLNGVAIVGSRKTSTAGVVIARRIAAEAVKQGWVVVSGLALGIDAAAHAGSLDSGLSATTIAVLAHGLENAKPASNRELGMRILDQGGAWVSEYAVGTPALPAQFVQRNRIQLGLSVGSIIVEAEEKSGSITQAKFCIKQKRPLFAVVPEFTDNKLNLVCSGTEMLVKEFGASPIRTKLDYEQMFARLNNHKDMMKIVNQDILDF